LISLLLVSYLGLTLLPVSVSLGHDTSKIYFLSNNVNLFQRLANWDGQAYLAIANKGYTGTQIGLAAYFPFYPMIIKAMSIITLGNYLMSALLVSWLSFLSALFFLYKLLRIDFNQEVSSKTIKYLLLFPFSFYFITAYSESLFLLLTVLSFYSFRKSNFTLSSILGLLATATRVTGIALFPALLFELLDSSKAKLTHLKKTIFLITIVPFGLLSFMFYLFINTGNALYFLTIEKLNFERTQITYPFKVILAYIKSIILHPGNRFIARDSTLIAIEIIVSILFFIGIVFVWFKIRKSYAVYSFIAWSLPLMTGRTGSILRYVIILFPCFILLGLLNKKYKYFDTFYTYFAAMLLAIFAVSFINGYWIA
jgi:Gpi18-like mannosyltransferase